MDYTDCGVVRLWWNGFLTTMTRAKCTPGLIVVDEAHRAIADSYQDLFDRNRKAWYENPQPAMGKLVGEIMIDFASIRKYPIVNYNGYSSKA